MVGVQDLDGWYVMTFRSDGEGGPFEVPIVVARPGKYTGTGDELGGGWKPGEEQLRALARGIAAGLEEASGPYWANLELVEIRAVPVGMVTLVEREKASRPDE